MASDKGLQTKFELQCKTSGAKEDKLTIQSIQKWLKESGVIGKDTGITDSDVQTVWTTIVKDKKELDYTQFKELIANLAKEKKVELKLLMDKLASETPK